MCYIYQYLCVVDSHTALPARTYVELMMMSIYVSLPILPCELYLLCVC